MAAAPRFKVYNGTEYIAGFKSGHDVVLFCMAKGGLGLQVRMGHRAVVYTFPQDSLLVSPDLLGIRMDRWYYEYDKTGVAPDPIPTGAPIP